jgi:hypothetical protein
MLNKLEVYDNGVLISVEDNRTVGATILKLNNDINTHRETRLAAGMWYLGYFWATDARARTNLTGMVAAVTAGIPLPPNYTWRDNNNNNVPMNAQGLITFSGYLLLYVNQVYTYSWALKAQIDACETLEDLDAIDIYSGWPDGNMDGTMPS